METVLRGTAQSKDAPLFEAALASVATSLKAEVKLKTPVFSELIRKTATDASVPAMLADLAGGSLARLCAKDVAALPAAAAKCVLMHTMCACNGKKPCTVASAGARLVNRLAGESAPDVKAAVASDMVQDAMNEFNKITE